MRNLIIILFLIGSCIQNLNAVEKKENALDSMLQNNLKLFVIENRQVDSTYCAHLNKYNKIGYPEVYEYIKSVFFSTYNYPPGFEFRDTINGMKAHYIDLRDYMSFKRILKKAKPVMSLSAITIEKNGIRFNYTLSGFRLLNKYQYFETMYAWFHCIYEYDCKTKRWILLESKLNYL